jgi:anti-sigma regulatory factor (Ser/Thr protein kinase)
MADFTAIVFLRGKTPSADHCKLAKEKGIILMSTEEDMFEACAKLAPLIYPTVKPLTVNKKPETKPPNVTVHEFSIDGQDFTSSGMVSTGVKSILKSIGYPPQLIRRIAISTYEGEMNVVMHARKARVTLTAGDDQVEVIIDDEGKGIPDVEQAMQEGFSTATEDQRAMGFGAGMGLPNIKKNSDFLHVTSEVGRGTRVEMRFLVEP